MKISLISTIGITTTITTSAAARLTMRDFYRIDSGSQQTSPNSKANEDLLTTYLGRKLKMETAILIDTMSMPTDNAMSFDNVMSFDNTMSMSMSMSMPVFGGGDTEMSMPIFAMSMPTCDTTYTCPAVGTCGCGGKVQDGGEICGCYTISSVDPPFDTSAVPAKGTWYCYQVDLDKTVAGCRGANAVSHAVLPTGFSTSCHFYKGGQDSVAGSDNWSSHACDNTAATGLKFDFGHSGSGDQLSVTYCVDVACEATPEGKGAINWVLKSGNDRCEIQVTEGAIPNCGASSDLCHPSCGANDGSSRGGSGVNGIGNGGSKNVNNDPVTLQNASAGDGNQRNWTVVVTSILGVAGVVGLVGVTYKIVARKNAAAAAAAVGGDAASISSVDTPL